MVSVSHQSKKWMKGRQEGNARLKSAKGADPRCLYLFLDSIEREEGACRVLDGYTYPSIVEPEQRLVGGALWRVSALWCRVDLKQKRQRKLP